MTLKIIENKMKDIGKENNISDNDEKANRIRWL